MYHTQSGFRVQFQVKYFSWVFEFESRRFWFCEILIFWLAWPSKIAIVHIEKAIIVLNICIKSFLPFLLTSCTFTIISCDETLTNSHINWLSAGANNVTTQPGVYEEQHLTSQQYSSPESHRRSCPQHRWVVKKDQTGLKNSLFCKREEAKVSRGEIRMKKHCGRWERCESIKYLLYFKGRDDLDIKKNDNLRPFLTSG